MKKPYFCIKALGAMVFILLVQTSFAQEVETQQQTNTDVAIVADEESSNIIVGQEQEGISTRAGSPIDNTQISDTHWSSLASSSPSSIFSTSKSDNSVDMSTGKVRIRIPITVAGPSDIKIPVELNYTTGGIKLRDVASWVGLGWDLSAGGKITRVLNGFPDKVDGSMDALLNYTTWTYKKNGVEGNFDERVKKEDTQPDLFYFEIPGKSGMFVLDSQGNAATIPYQNIKINYDKSTKCFDIIDDAGNRYLFEDIETTEVQTPYEKNKPIKEYESAWNLSEIYTIRGEYVFFEYKPLDKVGPAINTYSCPSIAYSMIIGLGGSAHDQASLSVVQHNTYITSRYLTKISWNNGRIEFVSSSNRPDVADRQAFKLDKINLYSKQEGGELLKSYHFGYGAFQESTSLRLDSINVSTPQSATPEFFRKFEYFTDKNLPSVYPHREMHYYELDHWGYYNGKTTNTTGIPSFIIPENMTSVSRPGFDDRTPNLACTRANSLKKVWVTRSGYEEFEYELNTYKPKFDFSKVGMVGGLRIKSITTKSTELANVSQKVRYEYADNDCASSGVVFNDVAYYHTAAWVGYQGTSYYVVKDSPIRPLFDLDGSHIRYGRVKEIFDNGSSNTYTYTTKADYPDQGYTKVVNLMNSAEIITYETLASINYDFAPTNSRFWKRGLLKEKINKDALGNETYREVYEYNFNASIKETITGVFPMPGRKLDLSKVTLIVPYLVYYDFISQPIYPTKKTVSGSDVPYSETYYKYDHRSQLKNKMESVGFNLYETKYQYVYDYNCTLYPDGPLKFMQDNNFSSVPIEIVKYKNGDIIGGEFYLYDWWTYSFNQPPVSNMYFNLREVKELLLKKPMSVYDFTESGYGGGAGGVSKFIYDENYVTKTAYEYNLGNKLSCVKERNKPSISFLYNNDCILPVAQIIGGETKKVGETYSEEAFYTSFEDSYGRTHARAKTGTKVLMGGYYTNMRQLAAGTYWVSYWQSFNDGVDWELYETEVEVRGNDNRKYTIGNQGAIIDEYRIWKKESQMQTKTYDSNNNVTSQTDENGKTTYYEYDAFGRLVKVLDNKRDIVKKYSYFIKK